MKLLYKNIKKLFSVVMTIALVFIAVAPETGYARQAKEEDYFPAYYGANNSSEDYYVWYRVKDDKIPMYRYLSDGSNSKAYENDKKNFRVLIVHHFDRTVSYRTIGGVVGNYRVLGMDYEHNTYLYYVADWTQVDNGLTNNTGESTFSTSLNRQINTQNDTFMTRGAQYSFICDYDREWKNGDANDHTRPLAYTGRHKYHFYFPDKDDETPKLTLTFAKANAGNLFAFDEDGWPWGIGSITFKNEGNKRQYYEKNGIVSDTWAVVNKGNANMKLVAYDQNDEDYTLGIDPDGSLNMRTYDDKRENWMVYVGEKCTENMLHAMNSVKSDKLFANSVRTIDKPAYLRRDEQYIIEEDAVLFVDSLLLLRGEIINKGIIVVGSNGCILSWDPTIGSIKNEGGDVIVRRENSITVGTYTANKQTLQLYGNLYAKTIDIQNSVIDIKNKGDSYSQLKAGDTIVNYGFIMVEKGNLVIVPRGASLYNGGKGSKKIGKDVITNNPQ